MAMGLSILNLSKRYRYGVKALDQLSLEIGVGMFGLLGPNGAGKSTLMRILATLQIPDEGEISFNGINLLKDPYLIRNQLGYLPQSFGVYPRETARSLLDYMAVLKGLYSKKQRTFIVDEVLDKTNLTEVQDKNVSEYSGGMKQRFGIAQLLLNRPRFIIVDEPTAGLDPLERKRFLNVLRSIGTENTVLFSTHIVEDVADLCNDMAIINEGKILKRASPKTSIVELNGLIWNVVTGQAELSDLENKYHVISKSYTDDNQFLLRIFSQNQPDINFIPASPKLEDVYFLTLKTG